MSSCADPRLKTILREILNDQYQLSPFIAMTQPTTYRFVTEWRLQAPVEAVWNEIFHPENWPEWWDSVKAVVALKQGDATGVGAVRRYTWKGALPYRLTFDMETTLVAPYSRLEGIASGELSGIGRWSFVRGGDSGTSVRYDWEVQTNKPWMRFLSFILRPAFEWNHDVVMQRGLDGLVARLEAVRRTSEQP
jgi:hypothetical protein